MEKVFGWRRQLGNAANRAFFVADALRAFEPEVIYVHKMAELDVIEALVRSGYPTRPHGARPRHLLHAELQVFL